MKIRIKGNSIRYRLKEPEVAYFKKHGSVTESIQLDVETDAQLRFVLQASTGNTIALQYANGTTIISIPEQTAQQWTDTALIGFDAILKLRNGEALNVLVEKDFK